MVERKVVVILRVVGSNQWRFVVVFDRDVFGWGKELGLAGC